MDMKAYKLVPMLACHVPHEMQEQAERNLIGSIAASLFYNDEFLGCAGIKQLWKGVGEAWFFMAPEAMKHSRAIARLVFKQLKSMRQYHRIQATVEADFKEGIRFMEFLGFKIEGLLEKYTADAKDSLMFAITRS
jgi:RimJ/RimL family protein N-acetyltransferase